LKIVPRVTEYKSDLMGVQIRLNWTSRPLYILL
jgi:hypothetical protein